MSDVAQYAVRDGIAVITMNNPPVNGLGNALRAGLMENLKKAEADAAVKGVVIIGSAKAFSGGADIREFGKPREKPDLFEVNDQQDAMQKPLVAAIGGFALGGGLELALGCHYRVAAPRAQLGLPEVKLGILPGSGGTQRLPRIIPMADAVRMMTTGNTIPAEKAKELGLVDEIVQGDLLEAAIAFTKKLDSSRIRRIRDMKAQARWRRGSVLRQGARAGGEGIARLPGAARDRGLRRGGGDAAVRRGPQGRARALPAARQYRRVEGAAPRVLRRAPDLEDPRRAGGHPGARDQQSRGDRRRHHGRRHRHVLRQRRHPGDADRHRRRMRSTRASRESRETTPPRSRKAASRRPTWTSAWP